MRNFIISDIHGNGNLYYSVIAYLENISKYDDITLYINGDLIDKGLESCEILLDVIKRINDNNPSFKIVYLGGNHELMMYEIYNKRRKGMYVPDDNEWFMNGGWVTDFSLQDIFDTREEVLEIIDFIGELKLYHKFNEKIDDKNIVLVHACCPFQVKDICDYQIKNNVMNIEYLVWTRKDDPFIPFRCRIGYKDYFSIVGHTPNDNKYGYVYHKDENYLNIDGGSAAYVSGVFSYNHYPLVEIKDDYLKILTFNNNNEIIYGNYFKNYESIPFTSRELDNERKLLDKNLKVRKLVKLPDYIINYEDWECFKKNI